MLDNSIAAARVVGVRIVLPGNVYNFGPDALPAPMEESTQHPLTKKGAIRVEMEKRLKSASQSGAGASSSAPAISSVRARQPIAGSRRGW